jgi:FkbM family methyltransferase
MLNKIKEKIKNTFFQVKDIELHSIGKYQITLPANHPLKSYQSTYKRYDIALGEISIEIKKKYQNLKAIDVGANIGDSAALISKYSKIPTLCIEGNKTFLPILEQNINNIGDHIKLEKNFIGPKNLNININKIHTHRGTASIAKAIDNNEKSENTVKTKSLKEILEKHSDFSNFKLFKTDTDGYDFNIIQSSIEILEKNKPIIFFEYDPSMSPNGNTESIKTIKQLSDINYENFIIYDNFGNYLCSTNNIETFKDLNIYLKSNNKYKKIVYYLDICAFNREDSDLFNNVKKNEIKNVS